MKIILIAFLTASVFAQEPLAKSDKMDPVIAEKVYRLVAKGVIQQQIMDSLTTALTAARKEATAYCEAKSATVVEQEDGLHCIAKPEPKKEENK